MHNLTDCAPVHLVGPSFASIFILEGTSHMDLIDLSIPEPTIVLELLAAFRKSKVMFAAVELGVFDALEVETSLDDLVPILQCDRVALMTLLDNCVAVGLLAKRNQSYVNTPVASTYLTQHSQSRMTGYIHYSNRVMWKMWENLEDTVREGTHRWKQTFDFDGPIFSHFFKTEDAMNEFLMGMHGFGLITSPTIVSAFDLSRFRVLADLGGATGHLAMAACERYSHLQGIVFDLPHALGLAQRMISQSSVADRMQVAGGDFFQDSLPMADLFALGRILHDWNDEQAQRLVQRAFDALPSGGGLLIAEKILWDDSTGPAWALLQSMNLLVCTEGRERTLTEYGSILTQAGFTRIEAIRTNVPLDCILAIKS
jgi:acetylserotonin O-methyltransferase